MENGETKNRIYSFTGKEGNFPILFTFKGYMRDQEEYYVASRDKGTMESYAWLMSRGKVIDITDLVDQGVIPKTKLDFLEDVVNVEIGMH